MTLMNIKKLSELLNIKEKTIYDWCHKRRIPYLKVGGLLRFDYDEIIEWLETKKQRTRKAIGI